MSEMFTKCNGFIVSGDPLVYADSATMTGQGTVSEPFGVKSTDLFVQSPLYTGTSGNSAYIGWNNETVLWSGTGNISTFTLSEKLSNFERFRMVFQGYNTPQSGMIEEYSPADGSNISYCYQHYVANNDGNPLQLWAGRFSSTDNLTYNLVNWKWMCMPGDSNAWSNTWNNNDRKPMIKRIIGINRKA